MKHPPTPTGYGPIINRFADVLDHVDRFAFRGTQRFAQEAGVHLSSVSRLIHNEINPTFALVARLTAVLEKELGCHIDPRDLVAEHGNFLTRSVCDLTLCRGCLPENALDEFGETKPAFTNVRPGTWVTSRYPQGYVNEKGMQ